MISVNEGLDRSAVGVHCGAEFPGRAKQAHTDAVPDDDDRPRDASSAADSGWPAAAGGTDWASASAPDDISELTADISAYHRELRAARRHAQWRRLLARPFVAPMAVTVVGFALAAVAALLLSVFAPNRAAAPPTALPVATHPSAAVGQVGGLLPAVTLRKAAGGGSVQSLALRPAVMALLPLHCQCAPLLDSLAASVSAEHLPLSIVAPAGADAEAAALSGLLDRGNPQIYYDTNGVLASTFGATDLTLVTVDRDGTIFDIEPSLTAATSRDVGARVREMLAADAQAGD